jgi:hypothetical protein
MNPNSKEKQMERHEPEAKLIILKREGLRVQ